MRKRVTKKLIHEGDYVAEVDVELEVTDDPWAPYLSLAEAEKLDQVRLALRRGDVQEAALQARVFKRTPVSE